MLGQLNRFTRKRLMAQGTAAPATVLEISDKGMTVTHGSEGFVGNTEVILKTKLRVDPPGEPSFETEEKFRYGQMSIPSVGSVLHVRFDPEDHDKIMLDESVPVPLIGPAFGGSTGLDIGDLLGTIREQRAAGGDRMQMAEALKASLGAQGVFTGIVAPGAGSPEDTKISQLERLAALHRTGALTDEEFATQKAAILGA